MISYEWKNIKHITELRLAKLLGIEGEKVVFNGNGKMADELVQERDHQVFKKH
jgi:diaminopimelate decarboxylase